MNCVVPVSADNPLAYNLVLVSLYDALLETLCARLSFAGNYMYSIVHVSMCLCVFVLGEITSFIRQNQKEDQ